MNISGSSKIAFLFKNGRRERLDAVTNEDAPSEFFYGFPQLRQRGVDVTLVEEGDLDFPARDTILNKGLASLSTAFFGFHAPVTWQLCKEKTRNLLNSFDIVIATTNLQTICLGIACRLGFVRCRIIGIGMGIVPLEYGGFRRRVVRWSLRRVDLILLSRGELDTLGHTGSEQNQASYLPFGVCHRFWSPGDVGNCDDYILSVGNDPYRDYPTLIEAWRPDFPKLKIVTRRKIPAGYPANIEVITGSSDSHPLSDAELRDLIRGSRFAVVPVRETVQPSGQSACLQAMACGKAVILSDIQGLWDRELMQDGINCLLVPPGDVSALSRVAQELLDNPERTSRIGLAARQTIEEHLNVDAMTETLSHLLPAP